MFKSQQGMVAVVLVGDESMLVAALAKVSVTLAFDDCNPVTVVVVCCVMDHY